MSAVASLLEAVRTSGIRLTPGGDDLIVTGSAGSPPDALLSALRAHKAELLSLLTETARIAHGCGVSLADLEAAASDDWPALLADLPLLTTFAHVVTLRRTLRRMREQGTVPLHYTAVTECAGCGQVPIFPGAPARVDGCPWCFNRRAGHPLPAPPI